MPYVQQRRSGRFTGYYLDPLGSTRSAGTYATYEEALFRAKDMEKVPDNITDRAGASQTYGAYVAVWLVTERRVQPKTLAGYRGCMTNHVLPVLGKTAIGNISTAVIRKALDIIEDKEGVSKYVLAQCRAAIGSSFKPLVPDIVAVNPTHGISIHLPPRPEFELIDRETFHLLLQHLTEEQNLFATFLISSGARFGEAAEVRRSDLNERTGRVWFGRRASELSGAANDGSRFLILDGTKGGKNRGRTIKLPGGVVTRLVRYMDHNGIRSDDLIFPKELVLPHTNGRTRTNTSGHLPNGAWNHVWHAAAAAAEIGWKPRTHDLRHAYATHLVAAGVPITEVQELLGHKHLETTMRYQHRVASLESKAADVMEDFLG